MLARPALLSLALALFSSHAAALDLDVSNKDSIKSVAKTLASGIVTAYNKSLEEDLTPGLFGKPYYFWESGNVFTDLLEYSYLTGDSQYNSLIADGMWHQIGELDAFMPPNQTKYLGNDDQSYWGLASLTAHEVGLPKPPRGEWIDLAVNVWNIQSQRWDDKTCGGGLRWQIFSFNKGYEYKNGISNGNFFVLSSRLAYLTGNSTYSDWASKSYNWANNVGLTTDSFQVFDGTSVTDNCSEFNHIQWSNDHALYAEGSAFMYNITNGTETWAKATRGYVNASSIFQKDNALYERACESNGKCSIDHRAFKSGTIRSLARAALVAPIVSDSIRPLLEGSAQGAAKGCEPSGEEVKCSMNWQDSNDFKARASAGGLGEVTSALSAVKALLWSDAKPIARGSGSGSSGSNSAGSGSPSNTSSAALPENTNAAGTVAASLASVLVAAFAAALSL